MTITNRREFFEGTILAMNTAIGMLDILAKENGEENTEFPKVEFFEEVRQFAENELVKMDIANEKRKSAPPSPKQREKIEENARIAETTVTYLQENAIDLTNPENWENRLVSNVAKALGFSAPKLLGAFRTKENEGKVVLQKSEVRGFKSAKVMLLPAEVETETEE